MSRYTLCPFFNHDKRDARITCEDTYRRFDSNEEKWSWMDMYCDNEWMKCPYAINLSEAYERLEKGDKEALEKHEIEALKKELKSMATKLGTSEKKLERAQKRVEELQAINNSFIGKNEDLEKQKKDYYTRWRKAQDILDKGDEKVQGELSVLGNIYEQRMAYLIDTYAEDGKLYEQEVEFWAGDKEFAIVHDADEAGRFWKVVFKQDEPEKKDEQQE